MKNFMNNKWVIVLADAGWEMVGVISEYFLKGIGFSLGCYWVYCAIKWVGE